MGIKNLRKKIKHETNNNSNCLQNPVSMGLLKIHFQESKHIHV